MGIKQKISDTVEKNIRWILVIMSFTAGAILPFAALSSKVDVQTSRTDNIVDRLETEHDMLVRYESLARQYQDQVVAVDARLGNIEELLRNHLDDKMSVAPKRPPVVSYAAISRKP